ncbi:MAG: MutS-related protein, partial [Chloroflexota bacterium]
MELLPGKAGPPPDAGLLRAPFQSILYLEGECRAQQAPTEAPDYFHDINLDQIIEAVTNGRDEYALKPFFYDRLTTPEAIEYRHEVMRDLENGAAIECVKCFAGEMRRMREQIARANKLYYQYQKERWLLHAAETYCATVRGLRDRLSGLPLTSHGLLAFHDYLEAYAGSDRFTSLVAAVNDLTGGLDAIQYSMIIKDGSFTVRKYESEQDYSLKVAETFRKFQQGAVKDYRVNFRPTVEMDHIEAKVLEFVTRLHPEVFSRLDAFCARYANCADRVLVAFDREVQFYVAYLEYLTPLKVAGLAFCYPRVSAIDKNVRDDAEFDLALATKLLAQGQPTITNDLELRGKERIILVSGPNQGGKTTFARTFGQVHHLASIGCQVPGTGAQLFLFDSMFTHFERQEDSTALHGKLEDDLLRIHDILDRATSRSIIIMNEIFNSTTLQDAVFLAQKVIERVIALDALC